MVETTVSSNALFEILHCRLCEGYLTLPVLLLPCQHSFCSYCVISRLDKTCSICGTEIQKLMVNERLRMVVDKIYMSCNTPPKYELTLLPASSLPSVIYIPNKSEIHLSYCQDAYFDGIIDDLCDRFPDINKGECVLCYEDVVLEPHEKLSNYMEAGEQGVRLSFGYKTI